MSYFKTGKLPPDLLERLLKKIDLNDPRVIIGPRLGEDAAVIDMGDRYLISKTDPITFVTEKIGWYGVNINANDVACMGAKPKWFLATLLLPQNKTDESLVESIFDDILHTCQSHGITLCGGHTEVTHGLDRPILIGQMLGEVDKNDLVNNKRVVQGDVILLTQGIAIEGTAILAREKEEHITGHIDRKIIKKAKSMLQNPGISIVKAAQKACQVADIHGIHDLTEGGLTTGLWELAKICGCGIRIKANRVPIFNETFVLCNFFGLDPWGLISSGAALISVSPHDAQIVINALHNEKIPCVVIGEMVSHDKGLVIEKDNTFIELKPFIQDELTKVFN
jgi:hydrogenase maturation factor